ncbi:MAG TPA: chorismate mutase [Gaiellaceae bacterium]|jgi:chorismate mutase
MSGETMSDSVMAKAREAIDGIDRELLALFNRRLDLVRRLHEHKVANELPLRDAGRESSMVADLQAANTGSLSDDGVAELFHHVLDLIRREIHGH